MENEVFRLVERLFSRYKGIIQKTEKGVAIYASNDFFGKQIDCVCSVSLLESEKYPYAVDVNEKTYAIKGGRVYPCKDIHEVEYALIECLKAFNFEEEKQMSLFDFGLDI